MGRNTRRYLAPRRRVSISMTMKPAATIAAFKFSVSAKSAAALRNSWKELIRLSGLAGRRSIALNGDAVVGRHLRRAEPKLPRPALLRTGRSMRGCAWNCDQLLGITAIPPTAPVQEWRAADSQPERGCSRLPRLTVGAPDGGERLGEHLPCTAA